MKKIPSGYLFSHTDLRKLIIPLVFEQLLNITVGMADTMMISGVGEAAVSGVSLVDSVNVLVITAITALSTGGAVVSGQFLGMKRYKRACDSADQVLLFVTFFCAVLMAVLYLLRTVILTKVFGHIEQDVFGYANTYFLIVAAAVPFIGIYDAGAALFRAQGNSKVSMNVSLLMNAVNLTGNAILIYIFKMGVAGAAIPTLFSRIVAAVIMLVLVRSQKLELHASKIPVFKPEFKLIKRILFIGIPNAIENSMFQFGKIITLFIVTMFGTTAITANAVAGNLCNFQALAGVALGQALLAVTAQCVGAGDPVQTDYYAKKLMRIGYIAMIISNIIIFPLLPLAMKGYNLSSETAHLTYIILTIHAIMGCLIWLLSFALPNALRAANDVMFTMIVSAASMWIFRVALAWVFAVMFNFGLIGVWAAMMVDWVIRSIFFTTRYHVTIGRRAKEKRLADAALMSKMN